jgi:hypothetical protein
MVDGTAKQSVEAESFSRTRVSERSKSDREVVRDRRKDTGRKKFGGLNSISEERK